MIPVKFHEIPVDRGLQSLSPLQAIGKDKMLITVGSSLADCNLMTASWGGLGVLWNKPIAICFVRESRHTDHFLRQEALPFFTLSFFGENTAAFADALSVCGRISGREGSKWEKASLTPTAYGEWFFPSEASMILCCRKLYAHRLTPDGFTDSATKEAITDAFYKEIPPDCHTAYYGEINLLLKEA